MRTKMITAPLTLPVTLDEAKAFYRVIGDEEDVDIMRSIAAATEKAEQITNRQLMEATYEGYLTSFKYRIKIPKPPFISISKVEYVDTTGVRKEWKHYFVDDTIEPAVLLFASRPTDIRQVDFKNVIVTYKCGYPLVPGVVACTPSALPSTLYCDLISVPDAIKSWILIYGLTLFENRENVVIGSPVSTELGGYYAHLLDSYRIIPI